MSALILTAKGQAALLKIKASYNYLYPTYGVNTFDRVIFENGKIPAAMIYYAIGKPSDADITDIIRQGYAMR